MVTDKRLILFGDRYEVHTLYQLIEFNCISVCTFKSINGTRNSKIITILHYSFEIIVFQSSPKNAKRALKSKRAPSKTPRRVLCMNNFLTEPSDQTPTRPG